jgi:hypothetical protein
VNLSAPWGFPLPWPRACSCAELLQFIQEDTDHTLLFADMALLASVTANAPCIISSTGDHIAKHLMETWVISCGAVSVHPWNLCYLSLLNTN